jgi:hypothetical protein
MDGSNKRKPLFIRTHAKPRCFKKHQSITTSSKLCQQQEGLDGSPLVERVAEKFDQQMTNTKRKILLIVDNVSSHQYSFQIVQQ